MERIPPPPDCHLCGRSVGLWEPILVGPGFEEPTTWLALSREWVELPDRILHHVCPDRDRDPDGR
ncbi:MAG: hypothetical protein U0R51_06275 [Solirubrobacterales bacterium]